MEAAAAFFHPIANGLGCFASRKSSTGDHETDHRMGAEPAIGEHILSDARKGHVDCRRSCVASRVPFAGFSFNIGAGICGRWKLTRMRYAEGENWGDVGDNAAD